MYFRSHIRLPVFFTECGSKRRRVFPDRYSSLDAMFLATSGWRCEDCTVEVQRELGATGAAGDDEAILQHKREMKAMLDRMDAKMAPIKDSVRRTLPVEARESTAVADRTSWFLCHVCFVIHESFQFQSGVGSNTVRDGIHLFCFPGVSSVAFMTFATLHALPKRDTSAV